MIIMLVFVPIIMIVAASYVEPIVRSYRASVNDQKTLLAKAVAESMFEIALWESRGGGTGSVSSACICEDGSCDIVNEATECAEGVDFGFGTATGEWYVYGTPNEEHVIVEGSQDWYTVPALGSGDAGGDYCSTAEPVVDLATLEDKLELEMGFDGSNLPMDDPFDWPCHWDKIREGESVVIPLFTENADGSVNNPVDLGLNQFELRFRAACNPEAATSEEYGNTICADGERYEVQGDTLTGDETVIVLWEIVGDEVDASDVSTGKKIILGQKFNSFLDSSSFNVFKINRYFQAIGGINNNSPTVDNNDDKFHSIHQHLDFNQPHGYGHLYMHRPYLNLLVVHTLRDQSNNTIPYLEYQFKATLDNSAEAPISSTSKVVRVDVMVDGGYSETLERTIALPKPVSGFVISQ